MHYLFHIGMNFAVPHRFSQTLRRHVDTTDAFNGNHKSKHVKGF